MVADYILFFGLALVAVASALGMLLSKSAVYSALNLVLNFLSVAIFFLLLNAPFISLVQITVYAGAIMVLFLFVIMLLGAESLGTATTLPWQRPLAIGLGVVLLFEAVYVMISRWGTAPQPSAVQEGFGAPSAVGLELYSAYLLPFEVVSILLLVAMVGAIVLSRKRERI
jgi:NADH-quinone oxidoreductase subunit J